MDNLLLWTILLPLLTAVVCALLPVKVSKIVAVASTVVGLLLACLIYERFIPEALNGFQMVLRVPWITRYQINFALGVDGLSLPLLLLSKFIMPIALLASWGITNHARVLTICFLVLDAAMAGTFLATDIFLFYIFWEFVLIPMILIIGVWGSSERIYAALKFFLVTFAGSLLMLVAIFWLYTSYHAQFGTYTADIASLGYIKFSTDPVLWGLTAQEWVFLAFALAFCIKVPLFPLHTWLPDAHTQAPTGGSIILAAVLLKMGTYGLLRFCVPLTPDAFARFSPIIAVLGLVGIVYGAWVAFQQEDAKRMVAYSSVSHLGFIVVGICALSPEALSGAVLQMVNHGLSTGGLFLLVGILYDRRHTRKLSEFGGLAKVIPWYAFFLVLISCSSMGVPGLNGFVGEFLILLGTFQTHPLWATVAVSGVVFAAVYTLVMLRAVIWGPVKNEENLSVKDINPREAFLLGVLSLFIVWLGVAPQSLLGKIKPSLDVYWSQNSGNRETASVILPPRDSVEGEAGPRE